MSARRTRGSSERGATAVVVAMMVAALCGVLGLAINVGHLLSVRSELQTAADGAALAGAQQLAAIASPTTGYPDLSLASQVVTESTTYSGYNPSDKTGLAINPGDVAIGIWNGTSFAVSTDRTQVNAVRVNVTRGASAATGPVEIAMASLMGSSATKDVAASAVAVVGGRCYVGCTNMPIAFVSCSPVAALCGQSTFISVENNSPNGQWTDYDLGNANPYVLDILQWGSSQQGNGNGNSQGNCPFAGARIDDCSVNAVPGVRNVDLKYIQDHDIGKIFVVPLVCSTDVCLNGNSRLRGFMTVEVVSVARTGNNQGITVRVNCGSEAVTGIDGGGGCVANGSWYLRPRLVK